MAAAGADRVGDAVIRFEVGGILAFTHVRFDFDRTETVERSAADAFVEGGVLGERAAERVAGGADFWPGAGLLALAFRELVGRVHQTQRIRSLVVHAMRHHLHVGERILGIVGAAVRHDDLAAADVLIDRAGVAVVVVADVFEDLVLVAAHGQRRAFAPALVRIFGQFGVVLLGHSGHLDASLGIRVMVKRGPASAV
jgi:hypothetical protein